ncbi:MAG: hypothetical protein IJK08_09215 [Prevotella sp.]|nr:hypothetical protein [Prevotella sp.]
MKRSLVLFGLIVCFAMGLSAQSILGKWRAQHTEEDGTKMTVEMTFNADKTLLMGIFVNMGNSEEVEMQFHVNIDGTYGEKNGNILPFKINSDNASVVVDKLEFKGEMAEQMKGNKELENGFRKLIQDQINASKGDLTNEIPSEGEMTITDLTATTMKVQMDDKDDEILEFVKVD